MAGIGSKKTIEEKSIRKSGSDSYEKMFKLYARSDEQDSDEVSIPLKSIEMWMKEVNILDDKKVTKDDISCCFCKIAKDKERLSMKEFEEFLCQLAADKRMDKCELMEKLTICDQPNQEDVDSKFGSDSCENMFKLYARCDDQASDVFSISLKSIEMWLKEVNILDDKKVTKDDISCCFCKIAKDKERLSMKEFEEFICQLAADKRMDKSELMKKLTICDQPNQEDADDCEAGKSQGLYQGIGNISGSYDNNTCDDKQKSYMPKEAGNVCGSMGKDILDDKNRDCKPQSVKNVSCNIKKDICDDKNKDFKNQL